MSAKENKAVAKKVMERLDARDLDGIVAHCAPDSVWHGFAPEPLDLEGYKQAITMFLDAVPDSRFPVEDVISEGNLVACRHVLRGTNDGAFGEIPASGNPVEVHAIVIMRIEGGKVHEAWLSADMMGMMGQIGAIPEAAEA